MKITFKTNLKCNGCIQAIRPNLDSMKEISHWEVDLNTPERKLEVTGEDLNEEKIILALKSAGYQAERMD